MRKIVLDVENTTTKLNSKYSDYSPYNPNNKLVSIGWCFIEEQWADPEDRVTPVNYLFLTHNEIDNWKYYSSKNYLLELFSKHLAEADTIVAHNAKYDIAWLEEAGFDLSHLKVEDTMIREYIMARGRGNISLRLGGCCKRYGVAEKGEIFEKYPDLTIDQMPIAEVEDYGRGDIQACAELYLAQELRLSQDKYQSLHKIIEMSNAFCRTLTDMERAGVRIDTDALALVKEQFTEEAEQLKYDLNRYVFKHMGDTKINLDSPQQLSEIIYSRRIKAGEEDNWIKTFNIGKDDRNKNLRRPKMSFVQFSEKVRDMCQTVMKTVVHSCDSCAGQGKVHKIRKDGSLFKKPTACKKCTGTGAIYEEINEIAGFKMQPNNINFTTIGGFSTSQTFLKELLEQAEEKGKTEAIDFLKKLMRLSSISSYLSNFVGGIETFMQPNFILHTSFNQCITATGRLSSTKPNLQNMPREATFPIRKVFVSRFEGGYIIDSDLSQLEFRIAGHLARDENVRRDILNGSDIHNQTREIISRAGKPITRQEAKSKSFKPLFAGVVGTDAEKEYYRKFLTELYPQIGQWHNRMGEEVIAKKILTTETGRQFLFPDVERGWNGKANKMTQIANFPVQSVATADLIPIGIIRLHKEMRVKNLKSLIVLSVHDSCIMDVHPEELDICLELSKNLAKYMEEEAIKWFDMQMFVPLANEVKYGKNAMNLKKAA